MTSSLRLTQPEKCKLKTAEGLSSRLTHHFLNNVWMYRTRATYCSLSRQSESQIMTEVFKSATGRPDKNSKFVPVF